MDTVIVRMRSADGRSGLFWAYEYEQVTTPVLFVCGTEWQCVMAHAWCVV